jgi:hypothetical protein
MCLLITCQIYISSFASFFIYAGRAENERKRSRGKKGKSFIKFYEMDSRTSNEVGESAKYTYEGGGWGEKVYSERFELSRKAELFTL